MNLITLKESVFNVVVRVKRANLTIINVLHVMMRNFFIKQIATLIALRIIVNFFKLTPTLKKLSSKNQNKIR